MVSYKWLYTDILPDATLAKVPNSSLQIDTVNA